MKNLFMYILIAGIVFGCGPGQKNDDVSQLRILIAKYNNALIESYKHQLFGRLEGVAEEKEAERVKSLIGAYLQGGQIMEAELHNMAFKDIKIEGDGATVTTSESWSYQWVNYKTGEVIEPLKDVHYEMLYHLIKKDGTWLVERTEEL